MFLAEHCAAGAVKKPPLFGSALGHGQMEIAVAIVYRRARLRASPWGWPARGGAVAN